MTPDVIVIMLSMAIFFTAFYCYAKATNLPLSSPSSMNEFFSGIFFLRSGAGLLSGRIALLIGFPLSYLLRFMNDGFGIVYFPLILMTWLIALYFFKYSGLFDNGGKSRNGFFSILIKGKAHGVAGVLLWIIRVLYFVSVMYVIFQR